MSQIGRTLAYIDDRSYMYY